MKETDLYKPVYDFFVNQGFTVRSEIKDCDIVAEKNGFLIVVELKKNLTLALITQSVKRQKTADLVYMAVPKPKKFVMNKKWNDMVHLIRRLELGLFFVTGEGKYSFIETVVEPVTFDRNKSIGKNTKKRDTLLKELKNRSIEGNIGGSTGKKILTAYREKSLFIAYLLDKYGAQTAKQLRELGSDDKKTYSILYTNVYGWFEKKGKGLYDLTKEGINGLHEYNALVKIFRVKH